jgi:fructose-specific phosphotransferase system IIC component
MKPIRNILGQDVHMQCSIIDLGAAPFGAAAARRVIFVGGVTKMTAAAAAAAWRRRRPGLLDKL